MVLPGGLCENGRRLREFRFRPVDGTLEMQLAEVSESASSLPAAVSLVLNTALEHIGGEPSSLERVRALCVADRQFLMRDLQAHLGQNGAWRSARCVACDNPFDFYLDCRELPVVEARGGYPYIDIEANAGTATIRLRLPNGHDQERLALMPPADNEDTELRLLLQWCLQPGAEAIELSDASLQQIDIAMDEMSPAVVTQISAACSHCGADQQLSLDPYSVLNQGGDELLQEVHQLAFHYHWSEQQILSLPRTRRHRYLALIDSARGMVQ